MRIRHRLLLSHLFAPVLFAAFAVAADLYWHRALTHTVGERALDAARTSMDRVDELLHDRVRELETFARAHQLAARAAAASAALHRRGDPDAYVHRVDEAWQAGADTPDIGAVLSNDLSRLMARFVAASAGDRDWPVFPEAYVTTDRGTVAGASGRTTDFLQADDGWYREAMTAPDYWMGDLEYDASSASYGVDIVIHLYGPGGQRVGLFKAVLDIRQVQDMIHTLQEQSSLPAVSPYLVNRQGFVLFSGADPEQRDRGRDVPLAEFGADLSPRPAVSAALGGQAGYRLETRALRPLLTAHAPSRGYGTFPGIGWSFILDVDARAALAPVATLRNVLYGLSGVLFLAALVFALLVSRGLSLGLERVTRAAQRLARRVAPEPVPTGAAAGDEVGELMHAFAHMSEVVNRAHDRLEQLVAARTRALVDSNRLLEEEVEERRRAEVELEAQASTLEKMNHELEAFSGAVATQLAPPLAEMARAVGVLQGRLEAVGDPEARDLVADLRGHAVTLGVLVRDMGVLHEAATRPMAVAEVSLSALARERLAHRAREDGERRVEWTVAEGLEVAGDPALLGQLMDNLVDNAWEATRGSDPGRIEVGEVDAGGERVFFVRDNGVGLDPGAGEDLFEPFRRVERADDSHRSGIGLALVRRIAHRHRGYGWIEGSPGGGATVYFVIGPAATAGEGHGP